MNISQYICWGVVAVMLVVFAEQAHGNTSESLKELAEIEKLMTSSTFRQKGQAIIMAGTDRDSLNARACIEAIRKEVRKFPLNSVSPLAVNASINGVLDAVPLVYAVVTQANKAIDIAANLFKDQDIDGASAAIKKGHTVDRELIFIAGVPVEDAQGFALALVGGLAVPGFKNTLVSIQKAGNAAYEVLAIADEVATKGIKIGGGAAEEAFKSARNVISTGSQVAYHHFKKAATHALEGLQNAASQGNNQLDVVTGIIDSLKTEIVTYDQAALAAIDKLNKGLKSAVIVLTKKSAIDAANVMFEGLKSTIVETADALSIAKKALEEAGKLASQDPEAAINVVRKGIKASQDVIMTAAAGGYLGLGAAGQIAGKEAVENLVPSVIDIEYGRVTSYEDLALAERTAIVGIRAGESGTAQGISSAMQMCDTAGLTLYQDFAEAGQMGFKALQNI